MNKSDFSDHMIETRKVHQGGRTELSVIVPCYNEAKLLMPMAVSLARYLDTIVGTGRWQFVIVSNGCKDNTPEVLAMITERWTSTISLRLERPNIGEAMRHGLIKAEGKWAFLIAVEFWDHVFLSWAWRNRNRYDLFIGSKRSNTYIDNRPKFRKILSWGLNFLLQGCFGLVSTDTHGPKLLYLPALTPILDVCVMRRGQFDTEFTLRSQRCGLKIAELPVPITETRRQRNPMLKKITQNIVDIIRLWNVMKRVPTPAGIHYHRYSSPDIEHEAKSLAAHRKISCQD